MNGRNEVKAAIVGAGLIAKQHLGALQDIPHVRVVGVCDLSPVTAEATADRFDVATWFTDFQEMLDCQRPDVVHITTLPASHARLARETLAAGVHVLVEKPLALQLDDCEELITFAQNAGLWLIEDYNYLFNAEVEAILALVNSGELGQVRHVDIQLSLNLFGAGSRFADRDAPHPLMSEPAGAIADFATHLAYLAHVFVGPHRDVTCRWRSSLPEITATPTEFQALVDADRGTATLGFSGTAQPDAFKLRVQGTRMSVETNLFDAGLVSTRLLGGAKPLVSIRNALSRARDERRNARRSLLRKLSGGPGAYEGLWKLVSRTYQSLLTGGEPPISLEQIQAVNQLVHDVHNGIASTCASL